MDLDDWFRGLRDWQTLMDLVHELPRGSHYRAALADDDELAEAILDLGEPEPPAHPPLEGWTNELEALTGIQDLLKAIAMRGSEKTPKPLPRPQTGMDRVKRHRVSARHATVLDQVLPGRH